MEVEADGLVDVRYDEASKWKLRANSTGGQRLR